MTLGEQLRIRRVQLNMTQAEVAERIGISRQAYISWENDKAKPRAEYKDKVYSFVGKTIDVSETNEATLENIWDKYTMVKHFEDRVAYLKKELSTMERILEILREEL